jgi:hypothetical protein
MNRYQDRTTHSAQFSVFYTHASTLDGFFAPNEWASLTITPGAQHQGSNQGVGFEWARITSHHYNTMNMHAE